MNCGVLDSTWPKMLERLKITDRNYMLTNNQEFGFILVFLYSCWMIKGNKNLEFQKKVTYFRKTSKIIIISCKKFAEKILVFVSEIL